MPEQRPLDAAAPWVELVSYPDGKAYFRNPAAFS